MFFHRNQTLTKNLYWVLHHQPVTPSQSLSVCRSINLFSPTKDPITQSCNIATQTDEHSTTKKEHWYADRFYTPY